MSFTTRCPACGTTFKIVPDQLKISDGWVRCGHCSDVFDATLFLEGEGAAPDTAKAVVQVTSSQVVPPAPPVPAVPPQKESDAAPPASTAPARKVVISKPAAPGPEQDNGWLVRPRRAASPSLDTEGPRSVPGMSKPQADVAFEEEIRRFAAAASKEVSSPEEEGVAPTVTPEEPVSVAPPVEPDKEVDDQTSPELEKKPEAARAAPEADAAEPPVLEPSFVVQARKRAFWQSRGMRVAMSLFSLVLLLALVLQIAVHDRDRLAAWNPVAGRWLAHVCRPWGCEVGPARQIESVVIDSSNLVRRLGNFYSFDLVLKNSAGIPVAMPALELSLTDTRDAVIVRRVFMPDELPGSPQLLPPQGAMSLNLRLSIADQGVSSMSGYRALAFYP